MSETTLTPASRTSAPSRVVWHDCNVNLHTLVSTVQVQKFWDDIDTSFPHYRTKPHFIALGRREAELLGGCGVGDKMYTKASNVEWVEPSIDFDFA